MPFNIPLPKTVNLQDIIKSSNIDKYGYAYLIGLVFVLLNVVYWFFLRKTINRKLQNASQNVVARYDNQFRWLRRNFKNILYVWFFLLAIFLWTKIQAPMKY